MGRLPHFKKKKKKKKIYIYSFSFQNAPFFIYFLADRGQLLPPLLADFSAKKVFFYVLPKLKECCQVVIIHKGAIYSVMQSDPYSWTLLETLLGKPQKKTVFSGPVTKALTPPPPSA